MVDMTSARYSNLAESVLQVVADRGGVAGEHRRIGDRLAVETETAGLVERDDVKVQVEDRLPGDRAVELADHHAGRLERRPDGPGDASRRHDRGGQEVRFQLEDVLGLRFRDDQRVTLGLGHDVHERQGLVVLAHHGGGR